MNETMILLFFYVFQKQTSTCERTQKTLLSRVFSFLSKNMQLAFLAKAPSFWGLPLIKTFVAKVLPPGGCPCCKGLGLVWPLSQGLVHQGCPCYKGLELVWPLLQGLAAVPPLLQWVCAVALVARAGSPMAIMAIHHDQMVDSFWEAVEGLAPVPQMLLMPCGDWQHIYAFLQGFFKDGLVIIHDNSASKILAPCSLAPWATTLPDAPDWSPFDGQASCPVLHFLGSFLPTEADEVDLPPFSLEVPDLGYVLVWHNILPSLLDLKDIVPVQPQHLLLGLEVQLLLPLSQGLALPSTQVPLLSWSGWGPPLSPLSQGLVTGTAGARAWQGAVAAAAANPHIAPP